MVWHGDGVVVTLTAMRAAFSSTMAWSAANAAVSACTESAIGAVRARVENSSAGCLRSVPAQILGHRSADVAGQRQTLIAPILAVHDDVARSPVDVVEPHPGHLAGPQPQPEESRSQLSRSCCACPGAIPTGSDRARHSGTGGIAAANPTVVRPSSCAHRRNERSAAARFPRRRPAPPGAMLEHEPRHVAGRQR